MVMVCSSIQWVGELGGAFPVMAPKDLLNNSWSEVDCMTTSCCIGVWKEAYLL